MILKKFSALSSALILALASLFTLAFSGQAQAAGTTLYWCEFSSNSNWNTAANWNTSSTCTGGTQEVPVSGDALVFNDSTLTSALDLTNDIPGLDLSSISLTGNGSGSYILGGDAISLDGGITDNISSSLTNTIQLAITLTTSQTFDNSQANDTLTISGTINIGSNNLTLKTKDSQLNVDSITGNGTLTFTSPPGGSTNAIYELHNADTSFSGTSVIQPEAVASDVSNSVNALGSGLITIENGGSLKLTSTAATATVTNPITLAGSGLQSIGTYAITSCLGNGASCTTANSTLTLSGRITLTGNAVVVNGAYSVGELSPPANTATFNFTGGGILNGYTLTGLANSATIVNGPTPPAVNSTGSSSTSPTNSTNPPKAPNTGEGLINSKEYLPIIGGSLLAISLVLISAALSKRFNFFSSSKK